MHDTLGYFAARARCTASYHHSEMTFSLVYAWSENFVLPDQPRRGRARQGLAAAQDAGRPVAAAGQPARLPRLHVGAPRQAADLHGHRDRPGVGVGRGPRARLVAARPPRAPRRARRWCATSTASYVESPALWSRDDDPGALRSGSTPTTPAATCSRSSGAAPGAADLVCVANFAATPHERLPPRAAVRGRLGRGPQHRRRRPTPAPASATSARSRRSRASWYGQPAHADLVVPPLATVWFRTPRLSRGGRDSPPGR